MFHARVVAPKHLLAVLGVLVSFIAREARAGETTMSEPVIEENITDIDGRESPTLEFDLTPGVLRAQHSSAGIWKNGLEMEWRPFDRAGLGLEVDTAGSLDGAKPTGAVLVSPRGALSYVLARDFEHNLFLQGELGGRYNGTDTRLLLVDPTEVALPYWAALRGAAKLGPLDMRSAVAGEAGGTAVHAPLRTSVAALYTILGETTRGALGTELWADWARRAPFVVAPQAEYLMRVFGKPVRFEVAVPITVGAKGDDASYGLAFRLVLEPDE